MNMHRRIRAFFPRLTRQFGTEDFTTVQNEAPKFKPTGVTVAESATFSMTKVDHPSLATLN
jgi:hypothetical protein